MRGFGAKFEEAVLEAFAAGVGEAPKPRVLLNKALEIGEGIVESLRAHPSCDRVELAGSARRLADSVKDLDIIATASDPPALLAAFAELDVIESAASPGENAARARTHTGVSVDLRVVEPDQFGNLLQHFTGSKAHNLALREAAVRRGLHVSEYGLLDDATGQTHRCATEEEVYELLGLPWIPPELRENRGELALTNGELPILIEQADLKGDLHMHTTLSDGRADAEAMAVRARELGLEYIAITDHSATHGFGNHVTPDALRAQIEAVRALDERMDGIRVLIGTETNIGTDGSPDYDDDLLAQLDWVVGSVHTSFAIGSDAMTERMIAAIEHPLIDAIGHPTGRKIQSRAPYAVDVERLIEAAARTGTDARDQLRARPPRPRRRARAQRGRGGREDRHRLRRPRPQHDDPHALGHRDRAPGVADEGRRRQHPAVGAARGAAQARALRPHPTSRRAPAPRSGARAEQAREQLAAHDGVDGSAAVGRDRGQGALGVAGRRVVERRAQRRRQVLGDEARVQAARQRQRRVGAGRGRGHEQAAVGQRLELGHAVVLAPRGCHEDARAAQQRAVLGGLERPGRAHAGGAGHALGARDHQLLVLASRRGPRGEHAIEALLLGVGRVGDGGDVARRRGGARGLDRDRDDDGGRVRRRRLGQRPRGLGHEQRAPRAAAGARAGAATARGARGGWRRRARRSGSRPPAATAARP